jgi:hypothetical protein
MVKVEGELILERLLEEAAGSEVVAWRTWSMHTSTRTRPAGDMSSRLLLFLSGLVSWLEAEGSVASYEGVEMRSWAIAQNPLGFILFYFFLRLCFRSQVVWTSKPEAESPAVGSKSLCGLETGGVWACAAARHHAAHASHVRQENGGRGFRRG